MRFAVVISKQNIAAMNISSFLEGNLPKHLSLHFVEEQVCFADSAEKIKADALIFASTHTSSSGKPTLSTHCIGNWGKAELGGKDRQLVPTTAFLLKNYLLALQKKKEDLNLQYEVCLEATHHGPFLGKPTVFIELGSSEKQWRDKQAAEAVAGVIISSTSVEGGFRPAIALGGGHYCPEFTKLVLRTDYALGHICPGYALPHLGGEMLSSAIAATKPKPSAIILDWKGLGSEKHRIKSLLEKQDLPIFRVRKLLG
ncbi:MAG: D-aminoacyl-tRNA deacylase [Candidatus Diapherotrites archaeon]|uniref:D-aminoacyl-tRNA deacylase n=1 Tax=Candidatus Iainarchaeum sp. TaxID=3101447 RepID=A0A938YMV7_9ARCH|nr:D-aminoacyl-tRNA deacylase [Candidatus Diapherotrites archaeon]